jgi:hypothetical protein
VVFFFFFAEGALFDVDDDACDFCVWPAEDEGAAFLFDEVELPLCVEAFVDAGFAGFSSAAEEAE